MEPFLFVALIIFCLLVFQRPRRTPVYDSERGRAEWRRYELARDQRMDEERWKSEERHRELMREVEDRSMQRKREAAEQRMENQRRVDEQVRQSREDAARHLMELHRQYIFNKGRRSLD